MNEESLRKLIREEVEQALDEADAAAKKPPQTFEEFRKAIGNAVKQAGGPPDLVDEIMDVGYEGGGVAGALGSAWDDMQYEYKDIKKSVTPEAQDSEMWEAFAYSSHDAVLNMVDAYQNAWNYEPGRKAARFDASDLAQRVQKILTGAKMKKADKGALKKMSGDVSGDEIAKAFIGLMKGESKTMKFTVVKPKTPHDSFQVRMTDPKLKPKDIMNVFGYASEQMAKVLTDMGMQDVKEHNVGQAEGGVTAKVNDPNTGIKKNIYVDFSDMTGGRSPALVVYIGVEEGR